jgi:hypothetical protein
MVVFLEENLMYIWEKGSGGFQEPSSYIFPNLTQFLIVLRYIITFVLSLYDLLTIFVAVKLHVIQLHVICLLLLNAPLMNPARSFHWTLNFVLLWSALTAHSTLAPMWLAPYRSSTALCTITDLLPAQLIHWHSILLNQFYTNRMA